MRESLLHQEVYLATAHRPSADRPQHQVVAASGWVLPSGLNATNLTIVPSSVGSVIAALLLMILGPPLVLGFGWELG